MKIIYENIATNSDSSTYGRILTKTGNEYSVDVEGVTYKIKSQFEFNLNERVLVLSPSGGTEKYLYPNKMGTSGEVVDTYTKTETDTLLAGKVSTEIGKGLSTNDYTTTEKTKLAGIAIGATANDTDTNLKNRANHTGTQSADTITDGTTNKVLSSTMKTHYDTAYTNSHTHSNKSSLDLVSGTNTGDETVVSIGGLINGATTKTTPVDADMVGLMDSGSSNTLKKLSWSNIKATLKTYFDTLYNNYVHPTQSAIASDNSNGVVIQNINVDNLGHTTSVGTVNLDNRYYTETEVDNKILTHIHDIRYYTKNEVDNLISGGTPSYPYGDYEPLTNGDAINPELIFYNGDIVMGRVN